MRGGAGPGQAGQGGAGGGAGDGEEGGALAVRLQYMIYIYIYIYITLPASEASTGTSDAICWNLGRKNGVDQLRGSVNLSLEDLRCQGAGADIFPPRAFFAVKSALQMGSILRRRKLAI
jgi:hypothetical protein